METETTPTASQPGKSQKRSVNAKKGAAVRSAKRGAGGPTPKVARLEDKPLAKWQTHVDQTKPCKAADVGHKHCDCGHPHCTGHIPLE